MGGLFIVLMWLLSCGIMIYTTTAYAIGIHDNAAAAGQTVAQQPKNPITRFTILFAIVAFIVIFFMTRKRYGWKVAIISGIAGAGAGPVMFELPFDWIIMWNLAVPTPVNFYRWLYFLPLFMFILVTLALLTLTPAARLRRQTFFALAVMFLLWAGWAAFAGFGYPQTLLTTGFNVASKFAAAVAGLMIFLPDKKTAAKAKPERAMD